MRAPTAVMRSTIMTHMESKKTHAAASAPRWSGRGLVLLGIVLSAFNLRTAVTSLTPLLDTLGDTFGFGATMTGVFGMLPTAAFACRSRPWKKARVWPNKPHRPVSKKAGYGPLFFVCCFGRPTLARLACAPPQDDGSGEQQRDPEQAQEGQNQHAAQIHCIAGARCQQGTELPTDGGEEHTH